MKRFLAKRNKAVKVEGKSEHTVTSNHSNKGNKKQKKSDKTNLFHQIFRSVSSKIIMAFAVNIVVAIIVVIVLVVNAYNLQSSYNEMLDNIFIANSATVNADLTRQGIYKTVNFNDKSYLVEAEEKLALYKENMSYILALGEEGNVAAERRQLVFDEFVSNAEAYFTASSNDDLQAMNIAYENITDYNETIKIQLDAFIVEEIQKSEETRAEIEKGFASALRNVIILFVVGFVFVLLIVTYVSNYISKGIKRLSISAEEIGNGRLDTQVASINSKDELHKLSVAFTVMQDNLKSIVKDQIAMGSQISGATSDLLTNVDEANKASLEIADSVGNMIEKMSVQKTKMADIGNQIGDITSKTGDILNISSKAKKEAIKSLEAVDLGEQKIDDFVIKMGDIKSTTDQTREAVDNLVKVASEMNGILESMNGISDQTTLLSLNASIEAARAGAEGRSFGVVAQEIRKLAENSGELGEDIGKMINDTQKILKDVDVFIRDVQSKISDSEEINNAVAKSFGDIKEINKMVDENNKAIDERVEDLSILCNNIETASQETFELVQENQAYTESISAAVEEEVATFEEIKDYVEQLDRMADDSADQISRFKL